MKHRLTEWDYAEATDLLMEMLKIRTVNGQDDEGNLAQFIGNYLVKRGIACEYQAIDEKRMNIIAHIEGESPETVVLCGHLDTVPPGSVSEWHTPPHEPVLQDGRVFCRGASDMKSGLAAMVFALGRLNGKKPKSCLLFIGTSDEEKTGLGALEVVNRGIMTNVKILIIAEPTGNKIGISQKGCLWLRFDVKGRTSHAAYSDKGINAAEMAMDISSAVKKLVHGRSDSLLGVSTATVTGIHAGISNNMLPDACRISMDIRTIPDLPHNRLIEEIHNYCRKLESASPGLEIAMEVINERTPVSAKPGDPAVKAFCAAIGRNLSREVEYTGINFFTDASILIRSTPEVPVLLFGPGEHVMAHQPNEYVELKKFFDAVDVYTDICRNI